jgi:hypothetical protein
MKLIKLYEEETGKKAIYRMRSSVYHTLKYVTWLENKLIEEVAPRKSGDISNLGFVFHCGNCNSTNIKLVINDNGDYKHFQYCPDCGTKVDWRNFI